MRMRMRMRREVQWQTPAMMKEAKSLQMCGKECNCILSLLARFLSFCPSRSQICKTWRERERERERVASLNPRRYSVWQKERKKRKKSKVDLWCMSCLLSRQKTEAKSISQLKKWQKGGEKQKDPPEYTKYNKGKWVKFSPSSFPLDTLSGPSIFFLSLCLIVPPEFPMWVCIHLVHSFSLLNLTYI